MLTYTITKTGGPLYLQIYNAVKADITGGILPADSRLPSKRKLAEHLGVSLITVENAYTQLIVEGYIYTVEKKGCFVSRISTPMEKENIAGSIPVKTPHVFRYNLAANAVPSDSFPFDTWARITRRVLSESPQELLKQTPSKGYLPLREAIAAHLSGFLGLSVHPEQVVVGSGTEYMYGQLIQMLGRSHIYGYEMPGHRSIRQVYASYGVRAEGLTMDGEGIRTDLLKNSDIDILHISPAHHFPSGITMPISRRYELLSWAAEKNACIIEDDYDREFRMQGNPVPPLFSLDRNNSVIYMNTFSKTLAPSFRISYMVLPESMLEQYEKTIGFYSSSVSSFEQIVLAHFIKEGYFERHLNRTRHLYRRIRNELLDALRLDPITSEIDIREENAGLHFLIRHPWSLSDTDVKAYAGRLSLQINMLSDYYSEPFDSRTILVNYSGLAPEEIKAHADILCTLFRTLKEAAK